MNVVVDSSVIIDFTRARLGVLRVLLGLGKEGKINLLVPMIVISELWAGREMATTAGKKKLQTLLSKFACADFTFEIAKLTGELLREKVVDGFDAIVAATALQADAFLATSNEKHFSKVPSLKFFKMQKG